MRDSELKDLPLSVGWSVSHTEFPKWCSKQRQYTSHQVVRSVATHFFPPHSLLVVL